MNASASQWNRALRTYQWSKNGLVFVPLLTSFHFTRPKDIYSALAAFLSFCFAASAGYLINDVVDRVSDRQHPGKAARPIAAGVISVNAALSASISILILAAVISSWVDGKFAIVLGIYVVLTFLYSFRLKRVLLGDVVTLASLYTLRIIAGALAIGVVLTSWLLAFSIFLFLSLAIAKRCAELVLLESTAQLSTPGRGYRVSDLRVLWPLGTGAGLCSIVVFCLYISAEETQARYSTPNLIWFAGLGLIYWLARLWLKTSRGEMEADPIVYAFTDRPSQLAIAFMVGMTVAAYVIKV